MERRPTILVVDDDPGVRRTLQDILRLKGYRPVTAATGTEGVEAAARETINLALIDLMLPDMSGLEVMERIKAGSPHVEAIILTGHASLRSAIEATNKGAFSYLLKPYQVDDLLLHVRHGIAQQQARDEIARLASHPRLNPNPVVELGSTGEVVYTNAAAERLFPDLAARGLGHPLLAGLESLFESLRREPQTARVRETSVGGRTWEEHVFWAAESGHLLVYAFDVTEQRRASAALQEMAAIYQAILDSPSVTSFIVSPEGVVRTVNEGVRRMLGYEPGEIVGRYASELIDPQELARRGRAVGLPVEATVEAVLAAMLASAELREYELPFIRKDGSSLPMLLTLTPLRDEKGNLVARLCIGLDLTAQKELDRMKGEFVSSVSHELRTPLTSIRGALGLLEGGVVGALAPEVLDLVRIARSNADRLIRLINDILDLDKVDAGKLALEVRAVAPKAAVDATFAELRALADVAGVGLASEVRTPRAVLADMDRIVQVLVNLVSNAIKFSPSASVILVVVDEERPGRVLFRVCDHGPGIAEHQLPKLFKKFQQLDVSDARRTRGTGLGLAISKALVERMGGTIGVESKVGEGSTFWFDLPAAPGGG